MLRYTQYREFSPVEGAMPEPDKLGRRRASARDFMAALRVAMPPITAWGMEH